MSAAFTRRGVVGVAAAALLALSACGGGPSDSGGTGGTHSAGTGTSGVTGSLNVFAAASLTESFTRIGKDFEAANPGTTVTFNFAGSFPANPDEAKRSDSSLCRLISATFVRPRNSRTICESLRSAELVGDAMRSARSICIARPIPGEARNHRLISTRPQFFKLSHGEQSADPQKRFYSVGIRLLF